MYSVCLAVKASPRKTICRERSTVTMAFAPIGRTTSPRTVTACDWTIESVWTRAPGEPTISSWLSERGPTTSGRR